MIIAFKGKSPQIGDRVYIAPNATIIGDVTIESEASVWFGAVLRGDLAPIRIGRATNIQDNCTVHTDLDKPAIINAHVTVGHNAVVHGCTVQDSCLIGMGAVILTGAEVGRGSIVAAGAVIGQDQRVGPHQLLAGVPAVAKKQLDPKIEKSLHLPAQRYLQMAQEYAIMPTT